MIMPLNQWVSQILSCRFLPLANMTTIPANIILVYRNELKLTNHDQTEIVLIFSMYRTRPLFSDFNMGNARLTTTASKAGSLGVVFDDNSVQELIKDKKVSHTGVQQNCYAFFITSKIDYCNSLLCGFSNMFRTLPSDSLLRLVNQNTWSAANEQDGRVLFSTRLHFIFLFFFCFLT